MRNLTQEEIQKIPELKAQGYTTHGIAKLYNVHDTCIRYWYKRLDQAGIKVPKDKMGRPRIELSMSPSGDKITLNTNYDK